MISIIAGNLCCIKKNKNADCQGHDLHNIKRLLNRPQQLPHALVWGRTTPREAQSIVVTHKHPRMNVKAVSVAKWCFSFNSLSRPQAAQGTSKTDCREQMGGSPKASPTASGRGNQPAGATRSPTAVAWSLDIKRDGYNHREIL